MPHITRERRAPRCLRGWSAGRLWPLLLEAGLGAALEVLPRSPSEGVNEAVMLVMDVLLPVFIQGAPLIPEAPALVLLAL